MSQSANTSHATGRLEPGQLKKGARAMFPVLAGVAPFALVAGLAGAHNGLSIVETAGLSLLAYAGAAQIAALELIGDNAATWVVVTTALVINLRFMIYSATLAPHYVGAGLGRRTIGSYLLVDHAVALALPQFDSMPQRIDRVSYYIGACLPFWVTWQVCSFLGSLLGSMPSIGLLAFAMPLSFLGLLSPHLREKPKVLAAVTAAVVSLLATVLPAGLGMVVATGIGIAAGCAFGWRTFTAREVQP